MKSVPGFSQRLVQKVLWEPISEVLKICRGDGRQGSKRVARLREFCSQKPFTQVQYDAVGMVCFLPVLLALSIALGGDLGAFDADLAFVDCGLLVIYLAV